MCKKRAIKGASCHLNANFHFYKYKYMLIQKKIQLEIQMHIFKSLDWVYILSCVHLKCCIVSWELHCKCIVNATEKCNTHCEHCLCNCILYICTLCICKLYICTILYIVYLYNIVHCLFVHCRLYFVLDYTFNVYLYCRPR